MSAAIYVVLIAMTPVGELRAAIPLGMQQFGLPWHQALPLSLVGNMVPAVLLLLLLPRISAFLLSFPNPVGRLLAWRTQRLRTSEGHRFQKYGLAALAGFVAVPLPMTGAWTGCLLAWAMDVPPRKSLPMVALGVFGAGIIVTLLTASGVKLAGLLS